MYKILDEPEYDGVDVFAELVEEEPVTKGECPAYAGHLTKMMMMVVVMVIEVMVS